MVVLSDDSLSNASAANNHEAYSLLHHTDNGVDTVKTAERRATTRLGITSVNCQRSTACLIITSHLWLAITLTLVNGF